MLPGGRLRMAHRPGVALLDLQQDELHLLVRRTVPEARRPERDRREDGGDDDGNSEAGALRTPCRGKSRDGGAPERREGHEKREPVPRRDEEGRDREDVRRDEGRKDEKG